MNRGGGHMGKYCAKYITAHTPKIFVLENVPALMENDKFRPFLMKMVASIKRTGQYKTYLKVLDTSEHGIPHSRKRMYLIGMRSDLVQDEFDPFPEPIDTIPLKTLLDTKIRGQTLDIPSGQTAQRNLKDAVASIVAKGDNPHRSLYVVNL
eukprot:5363718-Pyramimonas_sp.AAC.1